MASLTSDHRALVLYAVLARDVCDFLDMLMEEKDIEALKTLYLMFTTPNPKTSKEDRELNAIGADLVGGNLTKRGIALPKIEPVQETQDPPDQGELF